MFEKVSPKIKDPNTTIGSMHTRTQLVMNKKNIYNNLQQQIKKEMGQAHRKINELTS